MLGGSWLSAFCLAPLVLATKGGILKVGKATYAIFSVDSQLQVNPDGKKNVTLIVDNQLISLDQPVEFVFADPDSHVPLVVIDDD